MSVEYFGNSSLFPKGFPKFPVREYGVTPPPTPIFWVCVKFPWISPTGGHMGLLIFPWMS